MGKIVKNGVTYSGSSDNADNVKYNNNVSNLDATNVQEAIDKLDESVDTLNGSLTQLFTFENIQILTGHFTGAVKLLDSRAYREGNHVRMEVRFKLEASLSYTVPLFYIDGKFAPKTKSSLVVGSIDIDNTQYISVTGRLDSSGYYVFNQTTTSNIEPGSYYVSVDYSLLA